MIGKKPKTLTAVRLNFLHAFAIAAIGGLPPTLREIGEICGRDIRTTQEAALRLQRDGYMINKGGARGLSLTDKGREAIRDHGLRISSVRDDHVSLYKRVPIALSR